jgi:hypothetical protein
MSDPMALAAGTDAVVAEDEPLAALVVGGIAGALTFALCVLFLGAAAGIAIALVAAVVTLARRRVIDASIFLAAAALCAASLLPSTLAVFVAALAFGAGLALVAHSQRSDAHAAQRTSSDG